jgi:hypothetical protein
MFEFQKVAYFARELDVACGDLTREEADKETIFHDLLRYIDSLIFKFKTRNWTEEDWDRNL